MSRTNDNPTSVNVLSTKTTLVLPSKDLGGSLLHYDLGADSYAQQQPADISLEINFPGLGDVLMHSQS